MSFFTSSSIASLHLGRFCTRCFHKLLSLNVIDLIPPLRFQKFSETVMTKPKSNRGAVLWFERTFLYSSNELCQAKSAFVEPGSSPARRNRNMVSHADLFLSSGSPIATAHTS